MLLTKINWPGMGMGSFLYSLIFSSRLLTMLTVIRNAMDSMEMMTAAHTVLPENTSSNTLAHVC